MKKLMMAAMSAIVLMSAAGAASAATTVTASGSGWCDSGDYCNSDGTGTTNNFAGYGDSYRDWFTFVVPNVQIDAATLSIWNDGNDRSGGGVYNLFAASGFSWAGLVSGQSLGSVAENIADTGVSHYVDITLNSVGLAELNAARGTTFRFGGSNSGTELFGYTGGYPQASLSLSTAAVPEPSTWAMMLLGLLGMGMVLRGSRKPQAALAAV